MNFEETKAIANSFFEFPTENKDHVTTTSAILFALHCMAKRDYDAGRIVELESAITETLNDNGHLADGD